MAYFPEVSGKVVYEGPTSKNPLAFRRYDAAKVVGGKTMSEHLRFAVCYWHTFKAVGGDPFGLPTMIRAWDADTDPIQRAKDTMDAAFEFFTKLGVEYWCFHDRDIAPEGSDFVESCKNLDVLVGLCWKPGSRRRRALNSRTHRTSLATRCYQAGLQPIQTLMCSPMRLLR